MSTLKRSVFEAALSHGMVTVHVVPAEGLALPVEAPCALHYGLDMPRPITDLDVGPLGIRAVLSFSCTPVATFVPWEAVLAIVLRAPLFIAQWPIGVVATDAGPVEPRRLRVV